MAAGWVAFPGWLQAWSAGHPLTILAATLGAAELAAQREAIQPTTLANGLADLVRPAGPVIAAALVLGLVAAGLAFHPRGDAFLDVWLAISFATPLYSFSYDHLRSSCLSSSPPPSPHDARPSAGRSSSRRASGSS